MSTLRCCVCSTPVPKPGAKMIGGRAFCETHHKKALASTKAHMSRFGLIETTLAGLFVLLVSITLGGGDNVLPTSLGTGLILAAVPAVLFLVYIYRQDRIEPEPISIVLGVFVLGGLFAYSVAMPMADHVFEVSTWRNHSPLARLASTVLVVATLQELCKYVVVRYSVYKTDEFDEPADGVIYATAAGLGLATAINVMFVVHSDGLLPVAGATIIVTTTLVHVASGAVLGYGLAHARFGNKHRQRRLAACFAAAVLINGFLTHLTFKVGTNGATFDPWTALTVTLGVGALVLGGTHLMMTRFRQLELDEEVSNG